MTAHAMGSARANAGLAELRRLAVLTRTLAVAEFRLRYVESKLSYLWTIAHPLAFFAILYFVFTRVGRFHVGVEHYPVYLLTSVVLWMFFAEATATSVGCMARHGDVLRKLRVPHSMIPLSVVLTSFFDLCMNMIALFFFALVSGVSPRLSWLEVPPLVLLLSMFTTGVALILSSLYVRYRDVDQVWTLIRQALFYASPIFYVITALPDNVEKPLAAQPLAAIFTQARHALVDPHAPTAAAVLGGQARLAIPLGIVLGVFAGGVWVFRRESPGIAENL
jgi:ABC-2 type transport system permease protein